VVSAGSRVTVRVKRLRKGHRAKKVRAFGFAVSGHRVRRISAKKLHKGRYRVIVRAGQGASKTRARSLSLRVR
jgi:hypothetical protein